MGSEIVLARDMPNPLLENIVHTTKSFTVGFIRLEEQTEQGMRGVLLGSGTLVEVGNKRAILTAHHVVEVLPKNGRIGVLLDETGAESGPYTIDTDGLHFLEIDRGPDDALGPDLGAVVLAPTIASTLAARKTFFNLTSRREDMLQRPRELNDGIWLVQGFLDERTTERPDHGRVIQSFYNFSGFSGPEHAPKIDRYDYFEFPVSLSGRSQAPTNWGGMSGSGLWQVPLKRELKEIVMALMPLLSGVVFYQNPTTHTSAGVRSHGRESVYSVAYDAILRSTL